MDKLPETLSETIEAIQAELRELTGKEPPEVIKGSERFLQWLEELRDLRSDDKVAIANAIDALKRIVDGVSMNPLVTSGDKHYANRLNKLIRNLEEVVELEEAKKKKENEDYGEKARPSVPQGTAGGPGKSSGRPKPAGHSGRRRRR